MSRSDINGCRTHLLTFHSTSRFPWGFMYIFDNFIFRRYNFPVRHLVSTLKLVPLLHAGDASEHVRSRANTMQRHVHRGDLFQRVGGAAAVRRAVRCVRRRGGEGRRGRLGEAFHAAVTQDHQRHGLIPKQVFVQTCEYNGTKKEQPVGRKQKGKVIMRESMCACL